MRPGSVGAATLISALNCSGLLLAVLREHLDDASVEPASMLVAEAIEKADVAAMVRHFQAY